MPSKDPITFTSLIDQICRNPSEYKSVTIRWLTHCVAKPSLSIKEEDFSLTKNPDVVSAKLVLLFQSLKTHKHITKLEIVGCRIGEDPNEYVAAALGDLISRNIHLQEVILSHNYFSFNFIQWINSGLTSYECKLVRLDLSNNKLGLESVKHLAEALQYSSLKHLDLSYNFIGLPEAIRRTPTLITTDTISYSKNS